MPKKAETPIVVKKVKAYPIPVAMEGIKGRIVKLTATGFLVESELPLVVHHTYQSSFELPVVYKQVQFTGIVVKTYDRFRGELGNMAENLKLAEIYFKSVDARGLAAIKDFLQQINQK